LQTKEYRVDRVIAAIKDVDGRTKIKLKHQIMKLIFLSLIPLLPIIFLLLIILLLFFDISFAADLTGKKFRRPVLTKRSTRILIIFILLETLTFFFLANNSFLTTLFWLEIGLILFPVLGWILTGHTAGKILKKETAYAVAKLSKFKPQIIAVTGSYGKSTTKEFISELLSTKYKLAKTPDSQNTNFGLVRAINERLKKDNQYFVAEMGAYKVGEIANLCSIARPDISVITGIEPQHIELFGGMDNVVRAKYEIVKALRNKGTAIFNLNNSYCQDLYLKTKKRYPGITTMGYFVESEKSFLKTGITPDITAKITQITVDGINFKVFYKNEKEDIESNLRGVHLVENLLGAILVAQTQNVTSWIDIKKMCKKLNTISSTMTVSNTEKGIIIDDSHNSTPASFFSALKYLELYKNKKLFVLTSGIMELGNQSGKIHKSLGEKLFEISNTTFVTSNYYAKMIAEGMKDGRKLVCIENTDRLVKVMEDVMKRDFVLLIEGRMPKKIIDHFLYQKK
jgi:UDP-N-acetylmuramoyl-tripeptide--D-alanyl-D-alanine ligase